MKNDFEIVESVNEIIPGINEESARDVEIVDDGPVLNQENIGQLLEIGKQIVDIGKMVAQGKIEAKKRADMLKALELEADNYVKKVNADTNGVISKMEVVRKMMKDYNECDGSRKLSSEDFTKIVLATVEKSFDKIDK